MWCRRGAVRPDNHSLAGVHYSINYLTPYWDAEGGYRVDLTYAGGVADVNGNRATQRADGQATMVKSPPAWTGLLSETRVAARLAGARAGRMRGCTTRSAAAICFAALTCRTDKAACSGW